MASANMTTSLSKRIETEVHGRVATADTATSAFAAGAVRLRTTGTVEVDISAMFGQSLSTTVNHCNTAELSPGFGDLRRPNRAQKSRLSFKDTAKMDSVRIRGLYNAAMWARIFRVICR
jgi:hypothetical protein